MGCIQPNAKVNLFILMLVPVPFQGLRFLDFPRFSGSVPFLLLHHVHFLGMHPVCLQGCTSLTLAARTYIKKRCKPKHGNVFCALYGQDAAGTESGVPQRKTVGVPVAPLEHSF